MFVIFAQFVTRFCLRCHNFFLLVTHSPSNELLMRRRAWPLDFTEKKPIRRIDSVTSFAPRCYCRVGIISGSTFCQLLSVFFSFNPPHRYNFKNSQSHRLMDFPPPLLSKYKETKTKKLEEKKKKKKSRSRGKKF